MGSEQNCTHSHTPPPPRDHRNEQNCIQVRLTSARGCPPTATDMTSSRTLTGVTYSRGTQTPAEVTWQTSSGWGSIMTRGSSRVEKGGGGGGGEGWVEGVWMRVNTDGDCSGSGLSTKKVAKDGWGRGGGRGRREGGGGREGRGGVSWLLNVSVLCKELFVGRLTSQQHVCVSQGRICSDNFTRCHTEIEAADQTFHLTQSQCTDTGPTSPSTDPVTPSAWSDNF